MLRISLLSLPATVLFAATPAIAATKAGMGQQKLKPIPARMREFASIVAYTHGGGASGTFGWVAPPKKLTGVFPLQTGPSSDPARDAHVQAKLTAHPNDADPRIIRCEMSMKMLLALLLFPIMSVLLRSKDDAALLERLRNRDPDAMGELYDRYSRITYSVIYRVVRNQSVAEDLVQETFIRVWNRIQGFDQRKGALGPWILTVARNRSIDYVRSVDGRMAANSFEVEKMENPAMFANLETEILNMDRLKSLRTAFEKLDPNQRLVLELAYFEGLSQSEMAAKLKKPLGTVKTWVRGALQALREEMGEEAVA